MPLKLMLVCNLHWNICTKFLSLNYYYISEAKLCIPSTLNTDQCTLRFRVFLSKSLNAYFLFLICSLHDKNQGISSKICYLIKHRIFFIGDPLNLLWSQGRIKCHFHSIKWTYWPGCLSTVQSWPVILQKM